MVNFIFVFLKTPVGRFSLSNSSRSNMEKTHGASLGTGKTSESSPNNLTVNRNNFFNSTSHEKIDSEKSANSSNSNPGSDWISTPITRKKNQKKNNEKNVPSESSLTGNQISTEKNLNFPLTKKGKAILLPLIPKDLPLFHLS
jgi:hypothetical protein